MFKTFTLTLTILLTSLANAQDAAPAKGGNELTSTIVMFGVMAAIFYFMIIRPNKKRQKEHQNLMSDLKKGSEVITTSGIIGKVNELADTYVVVEIAPNVNIKFQRQAIVSLVPKGTYKSDNKNSTNKKNNNEDELIK